MVVVFKCYFEGCNEIPYYKGLHHPLSGDLGPKINLCLKHVEKFMDLFGRKT